MENTKPRTTKTFVLLLLFGLTKLVWAVDCGTVTEQSALVALQTANSGLLEGAIGSEPCDNPLPWFVCESDLRGINVPSMGITTVPDEICCLTRLRYLTFSDNFITELPSCLSQLEELITFDASGNSLTAMPALSFRHLRDVSVADNSISGVSTMFTDAPDLRTFNACRNPLVNVPSSLYIGYKLTHLSLSDCSLTEAPDALCNLEKLQALDLSGNSIERLPSCFSKDYHKDLVTVTVERTCLKDIPTPMVTLLEYTGGTLEAECTYVEAAPYAVISSDYSACPLLHCPNAQEDPVVPGREEISFNEFGPCRAGYECSGVGPGTPCPVNTYSLGGEATCPNVPAGSYTNTDTRDVLTPCEAGYKCAGLDAQPVKCDGTTAEYQDETGQTTCKIASNGVYVQADRTSVATCTKGHYCTAGVETECEAGKYQDLDGQSACLSVPPGYYTDLDTRVVLTACPKGYKCAGLDAQPVKCDGVGEYQDESGKDTCKTVPAGWYTNTATRDVLTSCEAGYKCAGGDDQPVLCPNGSYQSLTGQTDCDACSDWREITNAEHTTCTTLTGDQFADADHLNAVTCGAGSYMNSGVVTQCTAGSKCPGDGLKHQCLAGEWSAAGASSCSKCGTGRASADVGRASECPLCPENEYQDASGMTSCKAVPAGSYVDMNVRDSITECTAGYECPGGDTQPHECTSGTFSLAGASVCERCSTLYTSLDGASTCLPCSELAGTEYCQESELAGDSFSVLSTCPSTHYITNEERLECERCSVDYKCDGTLTRVYSPAPFQGIGFSTVSGLMTLGICAACCLFVVIIVGCATRRRFNKRAQASLKASREHSSHVLV